MNVPQNESQVPALEPPQVHLAHYRPDIAGKLEIHPRVNFNWQILYLLSAHEFRCRLGRLRQSAPCLYVIPPGFAYAASMRSYRHYSCHFSAAKYFTYAEVLKAHCNVTPDGWKRTRLDANPVAIELDGARWNLVNPIRHRGDMAARFQELIDRYRKEDRFGARACLYRLLELIASAGAPARAESRIQAFTDYLTHRIHECCSVEELAAECHLSRSQLNRLCREVYGQPAKELMLLEKLALAEVLLGRGTPVNETARVCGFSDPYYFSRLYRRRRGIPPSRVQESTA
jgi:AraC-like DNA-binding protein